MVQVCDLLFDRVADPADLEVVLAIESMTNERIRDELGDIQLVAPGDRISGPGSTTLPFAKPSITMGGFWRKASNHPSRLTCACIRPT